MPWLAWAALGLVLLWWLIRRWEARLATTQSFKLKFPISPMVFLSRRMVIESLVQDDEIQAAIRQRAENSGQPLRTVEKQVRRQAHELVPAFKAVFYFSIGYWMARILLLTMYRVRLVRDARDEYAKIGRDATVVLLMNHRSNMDVLLVNFLLARHSAVAHAAGEWARLWPLHHLVRLAGNYVVDRDSNDPLYRLVLKRYVQMAVTHGVHLAIFPEGSLTRDGQLRDLSFGLLNYAATASWPGLSRDVVFIPVSFNYDRIPEQRRLVFEDTRDFSDRGRLYVLYASVRFALKFFKLPFQRREDRYGWACASFGSPVSLRRWQRARGINLHDLSSSERRRHIDALGRQLMAEVQRSIPVRPVHLVATVLSQQADTKWKPDSLASRVAELRLAMEAAGAPIFDADVSDSEQINQALKVLKLVGAIELSAHARVTIDQSQIPLLRYYANTVSHYLIAPRTDGLMDQPAEATVQERRELLATVYDSFSRVQGRSVDGQSFFERFYQEFLDSSPQVAEKFSDSDMPQQQAHLKASLKHMVDFAVSGKPGARMRQIARMHGQTGTDISPPLYDLWMHSLLLAIRRFDADHNPRVDLAWRSMMAPGIAYMRSQYDAEVVAAEPAAMGGAGANEGIACWVDHWAQRAPDRLALKSPERSLTYVELANEAGCLAAGLHSRLGVDAGDRVAFLGRNCVEFVVLVFACARLGAVLVPLNFRLAATESAELIKRAQARVLFVDQHCRTQDLEHASARTRVLLDAAGVADGEIGYQQLLQVPGPMRANQGTPESALFIVFTSGSTGDPKGAVLTQRAVHYNALNSRVMHDLTRSDHVATCLPFFHVGGINIQTLPTIQVGATVTILPDFDPASFIHFVEREKPTLTVLVPAQMQLLMLLPNWPTCDFTSLRAVSTGSTIVSQDLIRAWAEKGVPVIQVYGCTESGPIAAHQTVDGIRSGWGTVGHPALYTEVSIADPDGRPAAAGAEGEVLLRGRNLASHYWNDPTATEQAFANGWLHTGDLGYIDTTGRLCIVGRKKRLIISGGENIHPAEIEHTLEQHPGVVEAAVVGIADPKWAEVPVAVVAADSSKINEQSLRIHLDQRLGRYKHPRHIFFTDTLPRTGLGKIAYPKVQSLVETQLHKPAAGTEEI